MDMNIHPALARISLALLLSLCLSGPVLASPEHDLRLIEEQRQHAIRAKDFAALSNIYAPDFLGVTGTGQLLRRDDLFRIFERTDPALQFATDEVRVVVHGETAVFFGRLVATTPAGVTLFASRFSHVFVKRGAAWVCVAGQATPIAKS
jgi:ketosteroid isomerase-like protein